LNGATVLILGVSYKRDVDDVRESPALEIIELLKKKGASVTFSDPHVDLLKDGELEMKGVPLTRDVLKSADMVVIVTDHKKFDYKLIVEHSSILLDTRNATKGMKSAKIIKI
jgi:UDP-N-acetyl-D-glucosamine dehydrogenase